MNKFTWTRKRMLIGVVVICIVAMSGLTVWLNMGRVAEAAVLNPHPGLVGWWRFDEGTGTVAGDSSGNGYNGMIYGAATWVTGKYGDALKFNGDGNGNYGSVDIGNVLNMGTSSFSISLWVNFNDVTARAFCVIKGGLDNAQQDPFEGYGISVYSSRLGFVVKDSATKIEITSGVATGNWYYVVSVCNRTSNTITLYVNGVQAASANIAGLGSLSNSYDLRFGSYTGIDPNYGNLNGTLDEVQIYNRPLSATEIQGNYQNGPNFSADVLAKVPKGTTQVITTLSWQGTGSINVTIESPSQNYTESMLPEYQKTVYSTSSGAASMLNIKRLSVSVSALSSDQNWYIVLTFNNVNAYQMSVEVQK
jgi:hypothetical protein